MKDTEFMVEKIRSQYTEQAHTELHELKALDAKVKKPAYAFGYTYGSIGAVIMGAGMSLVMTDIGKVIGLTSALVPGIIVGLAALVLVALAYPVYNRTQKKERERIAPQILKLTDELLK